MPLLSPPKMQRSGTRKRWNGVGLDAPSFLGQFAHLGVHASVSRFFFLAPSLFVLQWAHKIESFSVECYSCLMLEEGDYYSRLCGGGVFVFCARFACGGVRIERRGASRRFLRSCFSGEMLMRRFRLRHRIQQTAGNTTNLMTGGFIIVNPFWSKDGCM